MEKHGLKEKSTRSALQAKLAESRSTIRRFLALEGSAAVILLLVLAMAATLVVDWSLNLTRAQRTLISLLALAGIGVVTWQRLVKPLSRPLPDLEIALLLEQYFPHLQDRVITAVEFAAQPPVSQLMGSEQLLEVVVQQANEAAQEISAKQALDGLRLRRWLATGAAALCALAFVWAVFPATMNIWFQRNVLLRAVVWPQATYLHVIGFGGKPTRVIRGGSLDIVVQASGRKIPDIVRLDMQFASSGHFREELAAIERGRFVRHLEGIVEPFRFSLSGSDATTPSYAVELVEPPILRDVKFRLLYPPYTGLTPRTFGLGEGNLEVPVGTDLEMTAISSKPLLGGRVFFADREAGNFSLSAGASKPTEKDRIAIRLNIMQSGRLRLALDDTEGFTSDAAFTYPVFALPDRAPVVRLFVTGVGERVTKTATVPLHIEARDDYGVTAMQLRFGKTDWTKNPSESETMSQTMALRGIPLPNRLVQFDWIWSLEPLNLNEGETIFFRAEARDAAVLPGGGNRAESAIFALRTVSAAELLEELQKRQKAFRIEFERMTHRQRETVDATKLLLDHASAGRLLGALGKGAGSPSAIVADERDLGNSSQTMSDQFARVLAEMRNSRISTDEDYQRLEFRIIRPLREISQTLLGQVAGAMEQMAGSDPPQVVQSKLQAQVQQQTQVHEQMMVILTDMIKSETLADAIALLTDILKSQKNLSDATRKQLEKEINRLLGGERR